MTLAVPTFVPVKRNALISTLIIGGPLAVRPLLYGGDTSISLSLLVIIYTGLLLGFAANLHRAIVASLSLRFAFEAEKQKTDALNTDLRQHLLDREQTEAHLHAGVRVLADATEKITASLSQFLVNSTQTATAVSQTASTVAEVKQAAYVAGQKAQVVAASTQQTATVSKTGEHAVNEAIRGMLCVHEEIESIAQSVLQLGEQSHAIGAVIATVNELSEQSTLLAVTAAIEAAHAGEQGKGFGVVARETKTLSLQSQQATAQIRTILNDLQRAANVVVLVTEQGTKAIEAGVTRSLEAHQSIRSLASDVGEAVEIVTQIATASHQQLLGIDQVATAMHGIQQASQQNVDGMRQIETAALPMNYEHSDRR